MSAGREPRRRGRRTRATYAGGRPARCASRSGSASRNRLPERREVPVHVRSLPCWAVEVGSLDSPDTVGACHRAADSSGSRGRRRYRPGRPAPWAHARPDAAGASRSTSPRPPGRPAARCAPPRPRALGQRRGRGARAAVRGRRRRRRDPTKRPETMPSHQGEIAFPGGKLDPALDADLRATALREAHEEIGLDPGRRRDRRAARRDRHGRVALRDHAVRRVPAPDDRR